MKNFMKIAAVAALMIVSGNINAQDEFGGKKGAFGTEIQFNPFSNNFETFRIDGLSFRYFISDEHALRLKFNVELDKGESTAVFRKSGGSAFSAADYACARHAAHVFRQ